MISTKKPSVRLPSHIIPETYELTLKPDLESFTFEGSETIHIRINKSSNKITLHAKELQIESAELSTPYHPVSAKGGSTPPIHLRHLLRPTFAKATAGKQGFGGQERRGLLQTQFAERIEYDQKAETATFTFKKPFPEGQAQLKLAFRGLLTDSMRGFYRSAYEHNGQKKHLATTQFEATDARRAFPCFDEPAQKAVFKVKLIVPGHMSAISNTVETSVAEHQGGYKILEFAPTPKMSTYLLAFIIGEMEYIEGHTKEGVRVRVYTTPGKKHQAEFSLGVAIKTLSFFNDYFGINYPLPVMDMIAIPDFSSGAMENWGAITYRESALLVDPNQSSLQNKQWVALVVAHELAHQWFGNLVTMEWWTHLWLNEGFASYIEYLAVNHIFPEWDIWTQFANSDLGVALQLDGLASTHPIEVNVHHPDEIGEIFDAVSYSKGACVIRMLAEYLGEKNFRDGLRHYLKKHKYSNTVTEDLWDSLEYISKKPVRKIMENWTAKGGYPLISVVPHKDTLKISQERFYSSPISKSNQPDKTLWHVPVNIISDIAHKPSYQIITQRSAVVPQPKIKSWFKLNAGETSFYRTRYEKENLFAFQEPIQNKTLPARDRLGIIRDAFALAEAGYISSIETLKLAQSFIQEDDYTVWVELATGLASIETLIYDQPYYELYRTFCRSLFAPIAGKVGWEKVAGEAHTMTLLRSLALKLFGYYGDMDTVKHARQLFNEKDHNSKNLDPDLRTVIYGLVAQYGNNADYNKFLGLYEKETLHEEKNRIGRGLTQFRKMNLIEKTLKFSLTKHVRAQDAPSLIVGTYYNVIGKRPAWNFVKSHWGEILKRYDPSSHMLPRFLSPAEQFHTKADLLDFKKFAKANPTPGADMAVRQTMESIESNIAWLKRDGKELGKWLNSLTA